MTPQRWESPQSSATITRKSPKVVVIALKGRLDRDAVPFIVGVLEREFAVPETHSFWDLEDLEWYHSAIRKECTAVILRHRKNVAAVHTFSHSTLVNMGVAVANVALGGMIRSHPDRTSFERDMERLK
jgi:hypothetical protein